ncbi:hypothetical protein Lal_00021363 [Lupinus albus]|nr:hypothetical protein Lal_00021363 [Lupinus albus]
MAGRGRGTSQNVPNDLLAHMSLNQNVVPSPSSHPLVPPGPAEYRGLDELCKQKPKHFLGGFAPDAANEWVQSLERIFQAMGCGNVQRVTYASYMLANEAENWWEMSRRQMETEGQVIVWGSFKENILQKYFPADLKRKK